MDAIIGAKWLIAKAEENPGCILGILGISPRHCIEMIRMLERNVLEINPCQYIPNQLTLYWMNGSKAYHFSNFDTGQLCGHQFHYAWVDGDVSEEFKQNLSYCMRLGDKPQTIFTCDSNFRLDFGQQLRPQKEMTYEPKDFWNCSLSDCDEEMGEVNE